MAKRSKSGPWLKKMKLKSVFERPIHVDCRGLFKSLSEGIIHVAGGKSEGAAIDSMWVLSSLGMLSSSSEIFIDRKFLAVPEEQEGLIAISRCS